MARKTIGKRDVVENNKAIGEMVAVNNKPAEATENGDMLKQAPKAELSTRANRAHFLKIDQEASNSHGYGKSIELKSNKGLFDDEVKDVMVKFPVSGLTYLSLRYDFKTLRKDITRDYKEIANVIYEGDTIFAEVTDLIGQEEYGIAVLADVPRTMDEYLSKHRIPKSLRPIVDYKVQDPISFKDGKTYVQLNSKVLVTEYVIKRLFSIPGSDDLDFGPGKAGIEKKLAFNKAQLIECLKSFELTKIVIKKNKLFFGMNFDRLASDKWMNIPSELIVVANLSIPHSEYEALGSAALGKIRKRTKVKMVRTSEVINANTRGLILSRVDSSMVRTPVIELIELNSSEIAEIVSRKDANGKEKLAGKPLYMFKEVAVPAYAAFCNVSLDPEIDRETVKALYSDFYDSKPVFFRGLEDGTENLCPNVKSLSAYIFCGTTRVPLKVGVVTTATDTAIGFEATR